MTVSIYRYIHSTVLYMFYVHFFNFTFNVKKYCTAWQATDDNTAHAHCKLVTSGYTHILRICNSYCFFAENVVARMRLDVTLHAL